MNSERECTGDSAHVGFVSRSGRDVIGPRSMLGPCGTTARALASVVASCCHAIFNIITIHTHLVTVNIFDSLGSIKKLSNVSVNQT